MRNVAFTFSSLAFLCILMAYSPSFPQQQPSLMEEDLNKRGARKFSESDLNQFFTGKTIYIKKVDAPQYGTTKIYYADNNNRVVLLQGGRKARTEYQFKDGKHCSKSVIDKTEVCLTVYSDGQATRMCDPRDGGECLWEIIDRKPGDVERLY